MSGNSIFDSGAQAQWADEELFMESPEPRPGFTDEGPEMPESYDVPDASAFPIPPIDTYQTGAKPLAKGPAKNVYGQPRQMPTWQSGSTAGFTLRSGDTIGCPSQLAGAFSPMLSLSMGAIGGYLLGGWKGAVGVGAAVMGANSLGAIVETRSALNITTAVLGLGLGGYMLYQAKPKHGRATSNTPSWLKPRA